LDGKVTQKIKPPKRWNVHREASLPGSRFGGDSAILCSFPKCLKRASGYEIGYSFFYLQRCITIN